MLLTAHFWPAELRSPEDATAAGWIILLSVLAIGLPFGLGYRLGPRPKFSWPRYFFFAGSARQRQWLCYDAFALYLDSDFY